MGGEHLAHPQKPIRPRFCLSIHNDFPEPPSTCSGSFGFVNQPDRHGCNAVTAAVYYIPSPAFQDFKDSAGPLRNFADRA